MELKFRDLRADEIECRVGNTKRKNPSQPKSESNPVVGFQLLLYKNARVDANVLDETVGPFNWTKEYYQVKNTMFCKVGIKDKDTGEWVFKSDAGDDDFQTEQIKGEASDSFKRAAFAWGLGRKNLYYGPFIWLKCENGINEFSKLYVKEIAYKDSIISKLIICERTSDAVVYSYPKGAKVSQCGENAPKTPTTSANEPKGSIDKSDLNTIQAYIVAFKSETARSKFYAFLDRTYGTMNPEMLTLSQGKQVLNLLSGKGNN